MNTKIELHKGDLPENLDLGTIVAIDGEFMGLNVRRDPLCLIQISSLPDWECFQHTGYNSFL